MIDHIKFTVFFNPDGSPFLLWIDFFINRQYGKKCFSRSFDDWFWSMMVDHAPFHILDNSHKYKETYYCFDTPDYPRCLDALFAILEEHMDEIREDDGLPF